ncbi:kinase-like protein, partial [Fragilariopsis cylindrus CCMP1102]
IEKIQYCYDLASALEYIHSKNIIYKNLNPNTIGFCSDLDGRGAGVLKLFAFASSSCCSMNNRWYKNDNNKVTTATMAYQYMAPEMFLNSSYIDYKCDIYSFSMVCWKIFSHQTPFQSLTPQHYEEFVYRRGHRPIQNPA